MHTNKANKIQGHGLAEWSCQPTRVWGLWDAMIICFMQKSGVTYASCLCFLPLTKLSICSLEVFCLFSLLYSAHNSEMLFKIKQPFSSETLQSLLFVCVFVLTQCMNIDKTNCAAQWIFFLPIFHPFTWYTSMWNTTRLKFLSLSWGLSVRKRLCLKTVTDPRVYGLFKKKSSFKFFFLFIRHEHAQLPSKVVLLLC